MIKKVFTLVVGVAITFAACQETEKVVETAKAKDLSIYYEMVANKREGKADVSNSEITITNNGRGDLLKNWTIYFNQARTLVDKSVKGPVTVTNINGDFYKIEPSADYDTLKSNEDLVINFETNAWMTKECDLPVGFYIVFKDSAGKELAAETINDVKYAALSKPEQINRNPDDILPIPTPETRFEANTIYSSLAENEICPIIPTPNMYSKGTSDFTLDANTKIFFAKGLENEVKYLKASIKALIGTELSSQEGSGVGIQLSLGKLAEEAYTLNVSDKGVVINGGANVGVFYGIQSLRALLPVDAYVKTGKSVKVPGANVADAPRFGYRGYHLDVARNFHKKEDILNLLNLMSFYKLNKFHFHVCDDEGWRVEIQGLPELTEVGSKRGHSADESTMLNPAFGSGPVADAAKGHGTGFYTKADFIEILKYAKDRHIEIIPELDFPGHARAAIVSMKARYNKYIKSDANKAKEFMLNEIGDKSEYLSVQFYKDNVINVCQESSYKFLAKITDEMMKMYAEAGSTLKMVHTGGDEVPAGAWAKSPACVAFMATSEKFKKAPDLQYYFIERFSALLAERKITTGGWEEIGLKKQMNEEEGVEEMSPNKDYVNSNFVPYIWNTVWGWENEDRGYRLANEGYKVVMSNVNHLYFDLATDKDPREPGYYWGGYISAKKVWDFVPLNIYTSCKTNNFGALLKPDYTKELERLTPKGKANVLGIQGQLWSETVKGTDLLEYMTYPKLISLAERAWASDPKWSSIVKAEEREAAMNVEWNKFSNTLAKRDLVRIEYLSNSKKLNYRLPDPGAKIQNDTLYMNTEYPGFTMKYSLDGKTWNVYATPTPVKKGTKVSLKLVAITGREGRVTTVK